LALSALDQVTAPTLLIVGGMDMPVIEMNKTAYDELHCIKEMKIITEQAICLKNQNCQRSLILRLPGIKKSNPQKSSIIKD
jgi:hypothetical protein